ncbi:hypothetical protein Tco_1409327 [Tanacetum coccineum]
MLQAQIGNVPHADDVDIRPIYDEEPMAEVQTTSKINVFATRQQHTEQPEFNNKGEVDQNVEQCHDTCHLPAKLTDNQTTELSNQSLESENIWKPVLQPHRNQLVVRKPAASKSERPKTLKPRFASQVDVNNDLSKPVTTHYLPKEREYVVAKPHHVIASSKYRNSSKNMPRFSSNDMVHNHYLEEAKKKTQDEDRNSRPSVMPSARSQSTANGSKPKPRINNQKGKENGVNILKSIDEGPFLMGTFRETLSEGTEGALHLGPERPRVYSDLTPDEKERYNADIQATNILLHGLPKDIYSLINHYTD